MIGSRRFRPCWRAVVVCLALAAPLGADEGKPGDNRRPSSNDSELSFRLLDEDSVPVKEARGGFFWSYFIQPGNGPEQTKWECVRGAVSDASGCVRFRDVPRGLANVAFRHAGRGLVAIETIDTNPAARRPDEIVDVMMHPECRVSGSVTCDELAALGRAVGWTNVQLHREGRLAMEYRGPDGNFHFFLPPGDYTFYVAGHDIQFTKRPLHVAPDQNDVALGDVAVAASGFALLVGKPAPEFRGVKTWVNSPELKLGDLHGKWVLLTFLGGWPGDNAAATQMTRELQAVHDQYRGKELTIIAFYSNLALLPAKEPRQWIINGRATVLPDADTAGEGLPFPVGLVEPVVMDGGMISDTIKTDYGIRGYPTSVLIDPQGIIVGGLDVRTIDGARMIERHVNGE